jgi:Glycosyl hydrolase family 26
MVLVPAAIGVALVVFAAAALVLLRVHDSDVTPELPPGDTPAATVGALPAGRTWLSGAWTGGTIGAARIEAFGTWRGQPSDVVTTYPAYETWDQIADTDWHIGVLDGFKGRLEYGLPLVPRDHQSTLADVLTGKHDAVFSTVAQLLNKHGRGDSFVRIGLEANGSWFPWGADVQTAADFKAAFRHVQAIMKKVSPKLVFLFDITCGHPLDGSDDRMAPLTALYPGDDVVNVIGCDHYDATTVKSRNADEWKKTLRPETGPGLADVADFARQHHKSLAVPEWGLQSKAQKGAGDNPYFIYSMYQFFQQNKDILVFENYFNEPDDSLGSAIWEKVQNPRSAAEYKKLWGAPPALRAKPLA